MRFRRAIPYDVTISSSANGGYIVRVGCCTAVYTDASVLLSNLADYLYNPEETGKEYNQQFGPQHIADAVVGPTLQVPD